LANKDHQHSIGTRFLLITVLMVCSCGNQPRQPSAEAGAARQKAMADERPRHFFTLPEEVQRAAPRMQDHLYKLLPYNGPAHKVKPEFVFIDGEQQTTGRLNLKINHLNMLHLAYYQNGHPIWNGSLLIGDGTGMVAISERGYEVGLKRDGDDYAFRLVDGEARFTDHFERALSHQTWLEGDSGRLFLYYYVFPDSLTAGQPMGFEGVLPKEETVPEKQP